MKASGSLGFAVLIVLAILAQIASGREEPNGVIPNDPYFPFQWQLHNTGQDGGTAGADINAVKAWEVTTGDPNIVIAVIDVGVDRTHPDLIDNLAPGYNFLENDDKPDPDRQVQLDTHGTECAGVVAAKGNNGIGVAGVAYDCKITPIRHCSITQETSWAKKAEALRWAATQGADVISCSWDGGNATFYSAVQDVARTGGIGREGRGCVICFVAGNNNARINSSRASASPEVITVGATDHNDVRWPYSSYGPELDLVAPSGCDGTWCGSFASFWTTDLTGPIGNNIFNDDPKLLDYAQYVGGTSVSCPMVAGVAALMLSVEPNLTSDEVRHYLCRSARDLGDPGRDDYYGWGRVDARAALDMVLAKRADLNNDWVVDENDLAILTVAMDMNDLSADIAPAAKRDGIVDAQDRDLLMQYLGMEVPEPGLIAHWRFDETEGNTARSGDSTHDGTLYGGPVWQPAGGHKGGALQLDGVDDYVETPFVLDPSAGPFSIFAWVKGGAAGQVIVAQVEGAAWLAVDAAGALGTAVVGSRVSSLTSSAVITDGQWHRVGLIWDGAKRALYVDGMEVAKDRKSLASLAACTGGLCIGAGSTLEAGSFWSGLIDDVRVYDKAVKP